jgi:chemotaxis-related protein WspD
VENRKSPNQPALFTARPKSPLTSLANAEIDDCWNRIGVTGDGTCGELAKFVHCRNCPVYSAAGARLLDRELPPGYREDWTELFSREREQRLKDKDSSVIFRIGAEWLALRTGAFQEVAEPRPIHSVPHRQRNVMLGVTNIRGELLICVCLGRLLGIERSPEDEIRATRHGRLVVTEWQGTLLAFPVDEIHGIHRHRPGELQPAPATVSQGAVNFTRGMLSLENQMVGVLDEDLVFSTLNRSLT